MGRNVLRKDHEEKINIMIMEDYDLRPSEASKLTRYFKGIVEEYVYGQGENEDILEGQINWEDIRNGI